MTRFPSAEQWAVLEAEAGRLRDADKAALARGWSSAAQQEHASIASFSRFSLELLAVGAPPALLARTHRAALDEIDHARMSFRVAGLFAGQPLGPGPLPFSAEALGQTMTLCDSAVAAALDGCLNETLAALEARAAAGHAKPEALRVVLEEIASDEQAHAELAWEYVAWALATGPRTLRGALEEAVEPALQRLEVEAPQPPREDWSDWGLLEAGARGRLRAVSTRDVLRPAFSRLLGAR